MRCWGSTHGTLTTELHVLPPNPFLSAVSEYLPVIHSRSSFPTWLTPSLSHIGSWPVSGPAFLSVCTLDHNNHPGRVGGMDLVLGDYQEEK